VGSNAPPYLHSFPTRRSSDLGPPNVLCVVVVTTSAYGTGFGCSPAATRPAKWAMSTMSLAPTESAMRRNSAKSSCRGYADQPARSEEHTSELQSRENLVCRLL